MKYSILFVVLIGCGIAPTERCTVTNNEDGTYTLSCPGGSEVTVRDGERGYTTLVDTEVEPPGSNCPAGGTALLIGADVGNENGELDPEEVTSQSYVCRGGCTIVTNPDESKSVTCSDGSEATVSGISTDGVMEGSYRIENSADLLLLNLYSSITGNLEIGSGITSVTLPNLTSIGGHVSVANALGLTEVRMDLLESIGDYLSVYNNTDLQGVFIPMLSEIGADFLIYNNANLQGLSVPVLSEVGADFRIYDNPQLPGCEASSILSQLQNFNNNVFVQDNDDTAVCN